MRRLIGAIALWLLGLVCVPFIAIVYGAVWLTFGIYGIGRLCWLRVETKWDEVGKLTGW